MQTLQTTSVKIVKATQTLNFVCNKWGGLTIDFKIWPFLRLFGPSFGLKALKLVGNPGDVIDTTVGLQAGRHREMIWRALLRIEQTLCALVVFLRPTRIVSKQVWSC